jgi:porin
MRAATSVERPLRCEPSDAHVPVQAVGIVSIITRKLLSQSGRSDDIHRNECAAVTSQGSRKMHGWQAGGRASRFGQRLVSVLGLAFGLGAISIATAASVWDGDAPACDLASGCDLPPSCDADGGCDSLLGRDSLLGCDTLPGFSGSAAAVDTGLFGLKPGLQDRGINFQGNVTQFYFGNTAGGLQRDFRYGGHGDYLLNLDINKLGGPQGQFLQIRGEHRFGQSLAGSTGAFLPANFAADLPVADSTDFYLTNVLFTQALSESFALYGGKLDTISGDVNAFAHGRGIHQFSNIAFVANPIGLRTIAYSTLGFGFAVLQDGEPLYNFLVLNPTDTTETDGFSELFAEGVVISQELRVPTRFLGLPGHQLVGAIWSSRDYVALDQSPLILFPGVPIQRSSGSWAVTYNFDQYLYTEPGESEKGWGLFGRAGIADPNTNPIAYFLSGGVGGNSRLRGRERDTFGLGWYYYGTSKNLLPTLNAITGRLGDSQGGELFYNAAISPRMFLTTDLQVIDPARTTVDAAWVAGIRLNVTF